MTKLQKCFNTDDEDNLKLIKISSCIFWIWTVYTCLLMFIDLKQKPDYISVLQHCKTNKVESACLLD